MAGLQPGHRARGRRAVACSHCSHPVPTPVGTPNHLHHRGLSTVFPLFPLFGGVFHSACAHECIDTGNSGNSGNRDIYLLMALCFILFPLGAFGWERVGTDGARGATVGQPSPCKYLPIHSFHLSPHAPHGLPGTGQPLAQGNGERCAVLNAWLVRRRTLSALVCYASNVQTTTCVYVNTIQCAASIPRHHKHMRRIVISLVFAGFSAGPSHGGAPRAVCYADRVTFLYVPVPQLVVHGMGAGQSDPDRLVRDVA